MRMLSFLSSRTSGTARVAGFDVFHQPDEVRRRIGYMPENNPIHLDMRVREYLKFRARLKGLRVASQSIPVDTVLQQCGLTDVQRRIIGHLSKGYRQRVGLADALVHEPDLIILDEPTIGLDPHQIRSVRALIKGLARHHTVLLSTHILSEVEMTCSRVLILNRGRDHRGGYHRQSGEAAQSGRRVVAEIAATAGALREAFRDLPELVRLDLEPLDGEYHRVALTPAPVPTSGRRCLNWCGTGTGPCANSPAAIIRWRKSSCISPGPRRRRNEDSLFLGGLSRLPTPKPSRLMRVILTLVRRELGSAFQSLTGYVVIAASCCSRAWRSWI